jgi:hypothetical protein
MDQYADAWREAISAAGEKAAALLFAGSRSNTIAKGAESEVPPAQVVDLMVPAHGFEPWTYRLRSGCSTS